MTKPIIQIKNVSKSFHVGKQDVAILKNISFEVAMGDFLVIFGPSGCGKSTLLHTILGLEIPSSGSVTFLGKDLYADGQGMRANEDKRAEFRKQHVGMVYQQPNWIKSLTVLENTTFPLTLLGVNLIERTNKARAILKTVDMIDWFDYTPTELSSGQQQKVALARALVTNPEVIIADEPTGNLDFESGEELMTILTKLNQEQGKTIIMVTHDLEYLDFAKTSIRMFNGEIEAIYSESEKDKLLSDMKTKRWNSKGKVKTI